MFDPKVYRDACRELTAPEETIKEIMTMTEHKDKKIHKPLRAVLAVAALSAMMVVGVAAAAPEAMQEFIASIIQVHWVDEGNATFAMEDGGQVAVAAIPDVRVETWDQRAILTVDGEAVADITDQLTEEGRCTHVLELDERRLTVEVTGTVEDHLVVLTEDGAGRPPIPCTGAMPLRAAARKGRPPSVSSTAHKERDGTPDLRCAVFYAIGGWRGDRDNVYPGTAGCPPSSGTGSAGAAASPPPCAL